MDELTLDAIPPGSIVLRVSDLVNWEGCRRRWWWGKQYEEPRFAPALFVGTGVHAGLAEYYINGRHPVHALAGLDQWLTHEKYNFEDNYPLHRWDEVGGDDLETLIVGLVDHYMSYDERDFLDGTILAVEDRIVLKVDGFENVYLTGRLDVVLQRDSGVWVVDHKTFSERTLADRPDIGIEVDEPLTAYCYLWWKKTGVLPRMALYNVLVKSLPEPPRLYKNGRQLSIAQDQNTTAELFRQACKEHGFNPNDYLDYIIYLENRGDDRFFKRWGSSRNIQEMYAFERRVHARVTQILQMLEDLETWAYASGSSYRCGHCPFIAPCKAKDDGGDAEALLETYERKDPWRVEDN